VILSTSTHSQFNKSESRASHIRSGVSHNIRVVPGFISLPVQCGRYMVETWQVIIAASGILVTVLSVYGALIRRNYDTVSLLNQRLLGTEGDNTDKGFLRETSDKLDRLSTKMDDHHTTFKDNIQEYRRQVHQLDQKVTRVEYKVNAVAEAVEDEHDIHLDDISTSPDGGQPRENTRIVYSDRVDQDD